MLYILSSEQIQCDPVPYRKAVMVCLIALTFCCAGAFIGHYLEIFLIEHTLYKMVELLFVLLSCTVAHFPSKILGEPSEKLNIFFAISVLIAFLAFVVQYITKFNCVYIANSLVSGYTLLLLRRLVGMLRQGRQVVKSAECLCHMEWVILALNTAIAVFTFTGEYTLYPFKLALYVMYLVRMEKVLVEYGRQFIIDVKAEGADFQELSDLGGPDVEARAAQRRSAHTRGQRAKPVIADIPHAV